MAVLIKQIHDPLPRPKDFIPDLLEEAEKILFKTLAKDPKDRYQSMGELVAAMDKLMGLRLEEVAPKGTSGAEKEDPLSEQQIEAQAGSKHEIPKIVETKKTTSKIPAKPFPINWVLVGIAGLIAAYIFLLDIQSERPIPIEVQATNTSAFTPTYQPIKTTISPKDGMVMVYVPASEFLMGSSDTYYEDEKPQRIIYLDSYWIDQTEVTNDMYSQFLNEMGNQIEGGALWLSEDFENLRIHYVNDTWQADTVFEQHPVMGVSWYGAKAYCQWAGRRLPTEAEWEKAARGTDGYIYPWGNENPNTSLLNFASYESNTTKVGSYMQGASPYGALDMAGNVWEWVADWYAADFYQLEVSENPSGPEIGDSRVLRGGSWADSGEYVRSVYRNFYRVPISTNDLIGFRCASSSP